VGNLLMLAGVYTVLYYGGVYAQAEYSRLAARGDNNLPVAEAIAAPDMERTGAALAALPSSTRPASAEADTATGTAQASTITRLRIPSIDLDSKVVAIRKVTKKKRGKEVQEWKVPNFVVGHHEGSANPGAQDNVVMTGHVGGYSGIFENLFFVARGDHVIVDSNGQQYLYVVQEVLLLEEENAPPEQRAANARYIAPTGHDMVTLVTCWPPHGKDRYKQRVVVRARPYQHPLHPGEPADSTSWQVR